MGRQARLLCLNIFLNGRFNEMKKKTNKISRPRRGPADPKKGAVLLIAIMVASVALAVGMGVYNRTYKELLFASYWKQTQIAFSAADSGLECALYWNLHPAAQASCFGNPIVGWIPGAEGNFKVDIVSGVGPCVNVDISWNGTSTTTVARGYNDACDSTSLRRVERGLGVSF